MEDEFTERVKELKILYDKANSEPSLRSAMSFAGALQIDMEFAERGEDEIHDAVYLGFFARYYLVRKYARTAPQIDDLVADVSHIYHSIDRVEYPTLSSQYGYLLEIILSELAEDSAKAEKVGEELRKFVKKTGNPVSLLREINVHGLREKKLGNYEEAIKIFGQVDEFLVLESPEEIRHIANIINNRGLAKLEKIESVDRQEGSITIPSAMEDLISAGRLYLSEKEVPIGHLTGILNRFDKAKGMLKKLAEKESQAFAKTREVLSE